MTELVGQLGKDPGSVLVRFRLPHEVKAKEACVVGDFNDWTEGADPMAPDDDGFVAQVAVTTGRSYRFRYLLDGERWENDWAADAYLPNDFGGDDSVLDLTGSALDDLPRAVGDDQTATSGAAPDPTPAPAKPKRSRKKPPPAEPKS